jgi:hypothetical protein
VNLEFDPDESALLRQAGEVFARVAPIPASGAVRRPSPWRDLVAAGWADVGAALADAELSLGVALGLARAAGRQLLIEEFVTSGFLLSALGTRVGVPDARTELAAALRARPGVLLGDGRQAALPAVDGAAIEGFAFGLCGEVDVYRLRTDGARPVLELWAGAAPQIESVAELSPGVGTVQLAGDGQWRGFALDATRADLEAYDVQARLLHSAALVGAGERLVELTCDHVRSRVQFGVPIGSFQAVKHGLADAFTALAVAWDALLVAAADGADTELAPLVARLLAVDAALAAARAGAQFHGGMGFTAESNVHLFLTAILDGAQRFAAPDDVAVELGRRFVAAAC